MQQNNQSTIGTDQSTGGVYYKSSYSYPLYANSSFIENPLGGFTIGATVIRGLDLAYQGTPVFPTGLQPFAAFPNSQPLVSGFSGTNLSTTQGGTGFYFASPSGTTTQFGSTSQELTFSGIDVSGETRDTELYYRNVEAVNSTVVSDYESLVGEETATYALPTVAVPKKQMIFGTLSPKEAIGRGPGSPKQVLVQGGS